MPVVEPENQYIEKNGLFPSELNLDPSHVRRLFLDNHFRRTLPLLSAWDGRKQILLKTTSAGNLKTAPMGAGFEESDTKTGTGADTYTTANELSFDEEPSKFLFLIEINDVTIQFRNPTDTGWMDEITLRAGKHKISITSNKVRIKNRESGKTANYEVTGMF